MSLICIFIGEDLKKNINSLRFFKICLTQNNSYLKKKGFWGEKVKQKFEVGANGLGRSG
jgi:hypothetical protein